jgi:cyanate permease
MAGAPQGSGRGAGFGLLGFLMMCFGVLGLTGLLAAHARLRWMLILVTLLAGGFGSAMMLAVIRSGARDAREVAAGREVR